MRPPEGETMAPKSGPEADNPSSQTAAETYRKLFEKNPPSCPPKLKYKKVLFAKVPQHIEWLAAVKWCADQNPEYSPGDTAPPQTEQKQLQTKKPIPWGWVVLGGALLFFGGVVGGVKR